MAGLLDSLTTAQQVEAIYIAYFGRAADGAGYLYWENAAQTMSPIAIADSFAVQPEAKAEYAFLASPPGTLNPTDPVQIAAVDTFINQVYQNLFNRAADAPGLAYWQGQILSGAVSIGDAVYSIANGASTPADQLAVTDKIAAASYFTQQTFSDNLGATAPLSASFLHAAAASVVHVVDAPSLAASEAATAVYINPFFTITDNAGGTVVPPSTTSGGHAAEGSVITFTVNAPAGVANGTVENYVLTGTGSALSQVSTAHTGTVVVENGVATLAVSTLANVLGGAGPTLTVTLSNLSGSLATDTVTINEAQQAVTPAQLSVNEGSSINFTVNTTGVPGGLVAGSTENYTISGAPGQIAGADRSGSFTLGASGAAVVPIHTLATVFNNSSAPTFTLNFTNAGGVVSSAAVTLNETAILTAADNAGGTTTQGSFGDLITETTTGGTITDGKSVTFTISTSGVLGGAVAGTQEVWSLSDGGTGALSQVVGVTGGTVTLDANGIATVTVQTNYTAASLFSGGELTFSLNGLPVTDTVSVDLPALLYFTPAPNETLLGGAQNTTFVGVVDTTIVGNNTMSNGESAQGQAGFANTLDITVNSAATDVVPGSQANQDTHIQTLSVTDLNSEPFHDPGTYFNLQYMPDLATIVTSASDVSFDQFFNIQNLVDVEVLNNDYSGQGNLQFYVANSVAGGPVTVTLDNAGSLAFTYQSTNGADLVTAFNFVNAGDNYIDLIGAQVTQSITVNGTGGLWLHLDTSDNAVTNRDENKLYMLTSVDASGLIAPIPVTDNYQFGFDAVDIYQGAGPAGAFTFVGAQGNTFVDLNLEVSHADGTQVYGLPSNYLYEAQGGTFTITVNGTATSGNNWVRVNSYEGVGEVINVTNGGMNTSNTTSGDKNGGDYIDLHGWRATNQTLTVTAAAGANGNNQINIVSADYANVSVTQGDGNNDIDIDLWNGQVNLLSAYATVVVAVGNGSNDIHINTDKYSASDDYDSNVTVTAGDGANNNIHIGEGYNSTTNVTVGNGNGTDVHVDNYGGATVNITVGTGSDVVVGYHDHGNGDDLVTINLGDAGLLGGGDTGAGGTVWASVGGDSVLTENLGSGTYTIHDYVNGDGTFVVINALDLAGGGNNIYVDLDGNDDSAVITVGNGNNYIDVTDTPSLTGDYVDIQTGSGNNTINVDLSGVMASTVIVDAGNVPPTLAPSMGDNNITVTLDDSSGSASSVTIATGNGNNTVIVHGLGLGSDNVVNVTTGAGNDWIYLGTLDTGATPNDGITVNAGGGYNTLALNGFGASITDVVASVAASIQGFQALELTSTMYTNVDLLDLGPNNNINQVILDDGYHSGILGITLSGLTNNAELDFLWGQSGSSTLLVPIGNSLANPADTVNILLDSQAGFNSSHHFGEVVLYDQVLFLGVIPPGAGPVETVNITSTAAVGIASPPDDYTQVTNFLALDDQGIHTLNINGAVSPFVSDPDNVPPLLNDATDMPFHNGAVQDGDVYLNLDGSALNGLTTVNANSFYAGIQDTDTTLIFHEGVLGSSSWGSITFNAVNTTEDNLVFGNASSDTVHLGNYDNVVTIGDGNNDVLTMAHTTNVYGSSDGGNTVIVGSGNNDIITLGDDNGNANTITVGHTGHLAGTGDVVTLGDGLGEVSNDVVNINGHSTAGASVETITFNGNSGGNNTVTALSATGTTINLGAHTTADTLVFTHTTDSAFGYNDTVTGFNGATSASPDTIDLSAIIGGNTVNGHAAANGLATNVLQANGALAVLGLLGSTNSSGHDVVIYDYSTGTLYDFHGSNNTNYNSTNTFQIQVGVVGQNHFTTADLLVHS